MQTYIQLSFRLTFEMAKTNKRREYGAMCIKHLVLSFIFRVECLIVAIQIIFGCFYRSFSGPERDSVRLNRRPSFTKNFYCIFLLNHHILSCAYSLYFLGITLCVERVKVLSLLCRTVCVCSLCMCIDIFLLIIHIVFCHLVRLSI